MIEQIPIGDSLHLLHLGVMKRMLFGWRDGSFRNSGTKWSFNTISSMSYFLNKCKMPREIHRAVRGLDCLPHWKGTEYRTFLLYVGIIALKDHTSYEVYQNFLLLFSAVTICESRDFSHLLPVAKIMLEHFLEGFQEIYGSAYMTSNFHNLAHLVDEVMRFGELNSFSAYPFENMLGYIKRLIRNGRNPLSQLARRITEQTRFNRSENSFIAETPKLVLSKPNSGRDFPANFQLVSDDKNEFYSKIDLGNFSF